MPQLLTGAFAVVVAMILYFMSTGQLNAALGAVTGIVALIVLVLGTRALR